MYRLYFLSLVLLCSHVNAQSYSAKIKRAKFEMMSATIDFLATDTIVFKKSNGRPCRACSTATILRQFINDNEITGAAELIDSLDMFKIDTSSQEDFSNSILEFQNLIITRVCEERGRDRRKQLPGYSAYIQELAAIASYAMEDKDGKGTTTSKAQSGTNSTDDPKIGGGQHSQGSLVKVVLMTIVILLLVLLWGLFIRKRRIVEKYLSSQNQVVAVKAELDEKEKKIKHLNHLIDEKEEELVATKRSLEKLDQRATFNDTSSQVIQAVKKVQLGPSEIADQESKQKIKYARYADMGDGFSDAYLLDKPDNETIFVIKMSSASSASFSISNDRAAQQYALSNTDYFLGKTCRYDTFPSDNSRIYTSEPGELKKVDIKWTIVSPAKISFNS